MNQSLDGHAARTYAIRDKIFFETALSPKVTPGYLPSGTLPVEPAPGISANSE
jgi:hypothetical protein